VAQVWGTAKITERKKGSANNWQSPLLSQSPMLSWNTENIYLIVQTFGSKAALQAEHLTVFSSSSEKIAHSLPHSGHLTFTSFKVLLLSNPGQC
jgi:hypothetical protein